MYDSTLHGVTNLRGALMIRKTSKYNAISLSYQLLFSFSENHGVIETQLMQLYHIMIALISSSGNTNVSVEVHTLGVEVYFSTTEFLDIPKLVNRLKTHSAKQLFAITGKTGEKLWSRGYSIRTVGEPLDVNVGFDLLRQK